jgi:Tol biopolymer transport system component
MLSAGCFKQIILVTITLWLFASPFPVAASSVAENGAANSANNGLAVVNSDGAIYYLDLTGDIYAGAQENIYRLQPGDTTPALICNDEAGDLTISGKYLYYINWSDRHYIYRIKPDGSEKTKISIHPASWLTPADNSLIYSSRGSDGLENAIYKLALDNQTVPQKLTDDQAENLIVAGEWVYYLNASDNYRMYKIKLDGSGRRKLTNDQVLFMAVVNDTIYFSNNSDNQKLYTCNLDGQQRVKVTDDKAGFINVLNDWIYYTNGSAHHALYRINAKSHNKQLVCDLGIGPHPILLVNNLVYYNRLFFKPY